MTWGFWFDIRLLEVTRAAYGAAGSANAAFSTSRATGPAKRPPVLALTASFTPLINTEITNRGASAGAKAVIHA